MDNVATAGLCHEPRRGAQARAPQPFTVNGKKVDIPSYLVRTGDVIASRRGAASWIRSRFASRPTRPACAQVAGLRQEHAGGKGRLRPAREDIDFPDRGAPHRRAVFEVIADPQRLAKLNIRGGDPPPPHREGGY